MGDELQGAAADCNSAGATRAWFDSRVAHHSLFSMGYPKPMALKTALQSELCSHNVATSAWMPRFWNDAQVADSNSKTTALKPAHFFILATYAAKVIVRADEVDQHGRNKIRT